MQQTAGFDVDPVADQRATSRLIVGPKPRSKTDKKARVVAPVLDPDDSLVVVVGLEAGALDEAVPLR